MKMSWEPQFTHQDVEILDRKRVVDGYCPIDECYFRFRHFKEGYSATVKRELILRPKVVAVLLFDPNKDQVIMIEQIRVGAFHYPDSPWILEIVAGMVDEGESMEDAAYREALEEAGLKLKKLIPMCTYLVSPGISDEETKIYCGIVDAPEHISYHGLVDDGEDIKVHVLPFTEVLTLLDQGKITSASAVIAVQQLALKKNSFQ